ncbi:hypothetical protein D3C76_1764900 [compost metagenome]
MCRRGKAAGQGDISHLGLTAQQQLPRPGQAQLQVVLAWRTLQVLVEQPFQLAHRHFVQTGQFFQAYRLFQIGFHDRNYLAELGL